MGANLSQMIPIRDQSRKLGNPEKPMYFNPDIEFPTSPYHGIITLANFMGPTAYNTPDNTTIFGYQIDFTRFDTGRIFIVNFKRNDWEPICLENHILNIPRAHMNADEFHDGCFPDILNYCPSSYITAVEFRTEDGIRIFEPVNSLSIDDLPFNTIPDELNYIPRAKISELVAPSEFFSPDVNITVVRFNGDLYVFKNHSIIPLPESISWDDRLLKELFHQSKFRSSFILPPSYIVTGIGKSASKFRGFLHPYFPAGSLFDVILRLEKAKTHATHTEIPKPTWGFPFSLHTQTATSTPVDSLFISWPVKHRWAVDIASGLITLHKAESYIGIFGLQNLLLGRDGSIKFIDISPFMGFNLRTAAPEVNDGLNLVLTGPRDIFSLGLIFWQLAEEMLYSERETTRHIPRLRWHNGLNSVPQWFRILVRNCLHESPTERPSANVVLSTLIAHARNPTA